MARPLTLILFFTTTIAIALLSAESIDAAKKRPRGFVIPLIKDRTSNLYLSSINYIGINTTVKLFADLGVGGDFSWYYCPSVVYDNFSNLRVASSSRVCKLERSSYRLDCIDPPSRKCSRNICGAGIYNPVGNVFSDRFISGTLVQDTFAFCSDDGRDAPRFRIPRFVLACTYYVRAEGFPAGADGVLSLSKHALSLPHQLASRAKIPLKFALCLPASGSRGSLFIGGHTISRLFTTTTRLVSSDYSRLFYHVAGEPSYEYFMDVKSIAIDGKVVPFDTSLLSFNSNGLGGTKFSTVDRYSVLHSFIYRPLVKAFKAKAKAKKMVPVAPVAPFGACFGSKSIRKGINGIIPDVPVIDLVLRSGGSWRIHGSNSMIAVNDEVMCLAFVDGGDNLAANHPNEAVTIGGYQMEDHLVEFDIKSSKITFTSSLLLHNSSCSHLPTL